MRCVFWPTWYKMLKSETLQKGKSFLLLFGKIYNLVPLTFYCSLVVSHHIIWFYKNNHSKVAQNKLRYQRDDGCVQQHTLHTRKGNCRPLLCILCLKLSLYQILNKCLNADSLLLPIVWGCIVRHISILSPIIKYQYT